MIKIGLFKINQKILAFTIVFLANIFILSLFNDFDFRSNSGWRNTDVAAQTKHYKDGADFSEPTVNVSRKKYGAAFLETSLPLLPYLSSYVASFLEITKIYSPKEQFSNFGKIKIQSSIPYVSVINFTENTSQNGSEITTVITFEKYKNLSARLFDAGGNTNKFYVSIDDMDCGKKFLLTIDGKNVAPECHKYISNRNASNQNKMVSKFTFIEDGIHVVTLKENKFDLLNSNVVIYSMYSPASSIEKSNRLVMVFFISTCIFFIFLIFNYFSPTTYALNIVLAESFTAFYYFFTIFHEEPLAFSFSLLAILFWTIYKNPNKPNILIDNRDVVAFGLLGIAISLRTYYGIFLLFFIFDRFEFIFKARRLLEYFLIFKENAFKAILSIFLLVMPALTWFTHTQYRVRNGADSIDIFTSRVFLASLFNLNSWLDLFNWVSKGHITFFTCLGLITLVIIKISNLAPMSRMAKTFIASLTLSCFIVLPLIFDSAAHHDYYSFLCTTSLMMALMIYCLDANGLISRINMYNNLKKLGIIFSALCFILANYLVFRGQLRTSYVWGGDNYDFYVGAKYHSVHNRINTTQPNFLFDSGPQSYGLSGHPGYRPLDMAADSYESFSKKIESSILFKQNYQYVYWCDMTSPGFSGFSEKYFDSHGWIKFYVDTRCFYYRKSQ